MKAPGAGISFTEVPGDAIDTRRVFTRAQISVLIGLLLAIVCWAVFSYGYIEDDAYIHLEFARSLAEGHGYSFNGRLANGDTAPLWPLLLAGVHALGLGWIASAKLACVGGIVAAVTGVWYLARDLAGSQLERSWLPAVAVLVTVLNPFFVHWSFAGMESVSALGLSWWALRLSCLGRPTTARCLVAAILLGFGPLLRPELVLLAAVAGSLLLLRCWNSLDGRPLLRRLGALAVLGVIILLPLAIWSGYALETFGAVIPNTNAAKRGGPLKELAPQIMSVYLLGFPVTIALLPPLLAWSRARWRMPTSVWLLVLWPLACAVFYFINHTAVQTRYCLLTMPTVSIAELWLAARAGRIWFKSTAIAMSLSALAVVVLVVVPHVGNKIAYDRALSRVAAYVRDQVPSGSPVAVFAIGQIAFESRHALVDVGGITDASVMPYMGNSAATLRWARSRGARYYITGGMPEEGAARVFETPAPFIGWTLRRSQYATQHQLEIYKLP